MHFFRRLVPALALFLVVPSLGQSTSPDDGATEDNVYTNFFFQLRYPFSASWVPLTAAATAQIREAGQARLGDDQPQASSAKTYHLLSLARNFPGDGPNGRSRALILLVAEDLSSNSEIASAADCVRKVAGRLKQANFTAVGDPQEIQLSGRKFSRQELKGVSSAGTPVYESVYFTLARGHALGIILVAPSQPVLGGMMGTLDKLKFY